MPNPPMHFVRFRDLDGIVYEQPCLCEIGTTHHEVER